MELIEEFKTRFDIDLKKYLDSIQSEDVISEAFKYSILNGGKRVRPTLVFLGAIANAPKRTGFDEIYEKVRDLAIGIELIHSYSLVHDDLPCMDNDMLRRGQPTTHAKYGAGMATITGDAMLNGAAEKMLCGLNSLESVYDYRAQVEAVRYILDCSGIYGMVGGQAIDIQNKELTLRETIQMYKMKTSALLRAALVAGAIRFEASEYVIKSFEDYADNFGLLFQVVDDILDKTSTKEVLGKDVKKDAENNKATYVDLVGGIENAKVNCQMFAQRAINAIKLVEHRISYADVFYDYINKMLTREK